MIRLTRVSKSYGNPERRLPILKDVSLDIQTGEFVAIMGPSGSGKSTLLNLIGCLDTPDRGSIELFGQHVEQLNPDELARVRLKRIGFVFQSFNLLPRYSALHNVELPMVYARLDPVMRRKRAQRALQSVGLADRMSHRPSQLSGGQQQRIAIARALVNDPAVIIADEPTGALDSQTGQDIMKLFAGLHRSGKTIVMVTHEEDIAAYAHRIVTVRDGRIASDSRA